MANLIVYRLLVQYPILEMQLCFKQHTQVSHATSCNRTIITKCIINEGQNAVRENIGNKCYEENRES